MIKRSTQHDDMIFRTLCKNLLERKLLKVAVKNDKTIRIFEENKAIFQATHQLSAEDITYFFSEKKEVVYPYDVRSGEINMLMKSGEILPYSSLNTYLNTEVEERTFLFFISL